MKTLRLSSSSPAHVRRLPRSSSRLNIFCLVVSISRQDGGTAGAKGLQWMPRTRKHRRQSRMVRLLPGRTTRSTSLVIAITPMQQRTAPTEASASLGHMTSLQHLSLLTSMQVSDADASKCVYGCVAR
ncbi:uncharacterized protein LOC119403918 isoform X2 [Rhipicephalus sanguineus]|uniref:uncharacterized protein LOC119403918 isoform X2 n=1 Tax=Rhipicephalus sanguineus TaxID=34632 RepID=UPI0020C40D5B|nr:uncharacterized protein LOC119403918 isoform X2 [Rhipicephalus sanguineus]